VLSPRGVYVSNGISARTAGYAIAREQYSKPGAAFLQFANEDFYLPRRNGRPPIFAFDYEVRVCRVPKSWFGTRVSKPTNDIEFARIGQEILLSDFDALNRIKKKQCERFEGSLFIVVALRGARSVEPLFKLVTVDRKLTRWTLGDQVKPRSPWLR